MSGRGLRIGAARWGEGIPPGLVEKIVLAVGVAVVGAGFVGWIVSLMPARDDHLAQGTRVVLVSPDAEAIWLGEMEAHDPTTDAARGIFRLTGERPTSERLSPGTRAAVAFDDPKQSGPNRAVKVLVLDPPFAGMSGGVPRNQVRAE